MRKESTISTPASKNYQRVVPHSSKKSINSDDSLVIQRTVVTKQQSKSITIRITTRPFKVTESTT